MKSISLLRKPVARALRYPKGERQLCVAKSLSNLPLNFKKYENAQKVSFWQPSKPPKWANICPKISIFGIIYQPLELKIQPKVGLLRLKIMLKHFLNNSKTSLKKSRKRVFRPPKWPKYGCRPGKKCRFLGPFSIYELSFWLVDNEKKLNRSPDDS